MYKQIIEVNEFFKSIIHFGIFLFIWENIEIIFCLQNFPTKQKNYVYKLYIPHNLALNFTNALNTFPRKMRVNFGSNAFPEKLC